jgi:hypothetical protein
MLLPPLRLITALLSIAVLRAYSADQVIINGIKGNGVINIQGGGNINIKVEGGDVLITNLTITGAAVKKAEPAKPKFSPAVAKALEEFSTRASSIRRKNLEAGMSKIIQEVMKASKADIAAKAKLEEGAKKAIDLSIASYPEKLMEMFSSWSLGSDEDALPQIAQWTDEDIVSWQVPGLTLPEDHTVWAETVQSALNPAQLAEWNKFAADKNRRIDEEISRYLKPNENRLKEHFRAGMQTEIGDITTILALQENRLKKLGTAVEAAITRSLSIWRAGQMKSIRALGETERHQIFENEGGYYPDGQKLQRPEQLAEWKDSLKAELSAEEFERVETAHKERGDRRNLALALLLISELDTCIGFSENQRERLLPIALKQVGSLNTINGEGQDDNEESPEASSSWGLQPDSFAEAASKMPETEVHAILEPGQWARWQEFCKNRPNGNEQNQIQNKISDRQSLADIEELVNHCLHKAARDQEVHLLKSLTVKIEDAHRVLKLSPDALAKLSVAARGAVERSMGPVRSSLEEFFRNNLRDVSAGELHDRLNGLLSGLGNFCENNLRNKAPQEHPIWKDAIKAVLTTEQNELWQKELTARTAYRDHSVALIAISELDRLRRLTTEQFSSLDPLIVKIISEFSPDLTRNLGNGWHYQSPTLLVLISAIPEKELKTILTPAQSKLVHERDLVQAKSLWSGIKTEHDHRMKEPSEKERARRLNQ